MGKNEKIRIIVWSVLAVIFLSLGSLGYYQVYSSNKLSNSDEELLKNLIIYFDSSSDFENLRNVGIKISTKLKNNKIVTEYKGESSGQTYEFEYDKDKQLLNFKCKSSDSIGLVMIKNMLDAVARNNGYPENQIANLFNSINTLNEYTIENGMTYTEENGNIIVKINVRVPLKDISTNTEGDSTPQVDDKTPENNDNNQDEPIVIEEDYFTLNDLTPYKTSIINGEFNNTKNNIKMKTTIVNETIYISIFEEQKLDNNAYNSMANILKLLLDDNTYNSFINDYTTFDKGNTTSNKITVEKDFIIPAEYENEMINDNGELVRISFNKSLIQILNLD